MTPRVPASQANPAGMGERLLGMVSGETQHMMGASAHPEGKPQGRNYNSAIEQTKEMDKVTWKHKGALIPPVMSAAVVPSMAPRDSISGCHRMGQQMHGYQERAENVKRFIRDHGWFPEMLQNTYTEG